LLISTAARDRVRSPCRFPSTISHRLSGREHNAASHIDLHNNFSDDFSFGDFTQTSPFTMTNAFLPASLRFRHARAAGQNIFYGMSRVHIDMPP